MQAVVVHAAHDLRVEDRATGPLGEMEVRVAMGAGGICGSDLHYYHDGGIGDFPVREPLVLGHEMAGTIAEIGKGVTGLAVGTKVAVNPCWPCPGVAFDLGSRGHLSPDGKFAGSSRIFPHVQGFFQELVTVRAEQCKPLPADVSLEEAAMSEPLACCLHAVRRAGNVVGQKVLVLGAGPIGCLTVVAARLAGASEIHIADLMPEPLAKARLVGADQIIDLAADRTPMDRLQEQSGRMDVVIECAGAAKAVADGLRATRRGGTYVQFGVLPKGMHPIPIDQIVGKELSVQGTFRFWEEFNWAVDYIVNRQVDVRPLLTEVLPIGKAKQAFDLAGDRRKAMKVQIVAA